MHLSKTNEDAKKVVDAWAAGEWFTGKARHTRTAIKLTVYKVPGRNKYHYDLIASYRCVVTT